MNQPRPRPKPRPGPRSSAREPDRHAPLVRRGERDGPSVRPRRIALAHDWLVGLRGGELVLDRLARLASVLGEPAGLFTMFDDGRPLTPAIDGLSKTVWPRGRRAGVGRRLLLPAYPKAVAWLSAQLAAAHGERAIDLLVSSSSAAVKAMEPPAGVPHLCYCHAPARYLHGQRGEYARVGGLTGLGLRVLGPRLAAWDASAVRGVTLFVANSRHTAQEIQRVYKRDARVVHPPVRTDFFTPSAAEPRQDLLLVVSALEPYKRVDLAIDAAVAAGTRLMIVGTGSQESALRAHARRACKRAKQPATSVQFLGRVSDEQLRGLYRRARALLFPQVEDFGIAAVEAMACGCPVVARNAGGALDTVADGSTGVLFAEPEAGAILAALGRLPRRAEAACRSRALQFSEPVFDKAMTAVINELCPA
jgi:glycosyltransferase involved in cell wall biosynthesis